MDDSPGCLGSCFSMGCSLIGTVFSIVLALVIMAIVWILEPTPPDKAPSNDTPSAQPAPAPAPRPAPGRRPRPR